MEYILVYLIPIIIICILIYVFTFKPLLWPFSSNYISSGDNVQEGFGANIEDNPTASKGYVITDYEKMYPENLTHLESENDAINRLLFGDDSHLNLNITKNMKSDTTIIRNGKPIQRRKNKKNIESFKEGALDIGAEIKKPFNAVKDKMNEIKNIINGIPNKIVQMLKTVLNTMAQPFIVFGLKAKNWINSFVDFFDTTNLIIKNGWIEWTRSMNKLFIDTSIEFARNIIQIGNSFKYVPRLFMWIVSYIKCGVKLILNFPGCFKWYMLEVGGSILYSPIEFCVWYFEQADWEKTLWENIEAFNCKFHSETGVHITHYSDKVVERCYTCCIDDMPTIENYEWKFEVKWRPMQLKDYSQRLNNIYQNLRDPQP